MTGAPLTPEQAALLADALDLDQFDIVAVTNGIMTRVHREEDCARRGGGCWIHRPTQDWPLAGRPVYYRAATRMAYRMCEHDVLHPDIDAVAFAERGMTKYAGRGVREGDAAWHPDCDGCCMEPLPALRSDVLARVHRTAERIARDLEATGQPLTGQAYQYLLRNLADTFEHAVTTDERTVVRLPNEPWPFSYVCLGWADIVNRLVADLDEAAPGWRVTQIKEKFGTLNFSVTLTDATPDQTERAGALCLAAEDESGTVCDVCGAPGTLHVSTGWARTRCDEHADLVPRDLADPDAVLAKIEFPEGEEYRP